MSSKHAPNPVMRNTLIWSAVVIAALAVIGAVIGWFVDGTAGLVSAVVAIVVSGLFLGLTALAVLLAGRTPAGSMTFFAVFMAIWFVKFLVFVVLMIVLSTQAWVSPYVFFFSLVVAVAASLVVDLLVYARTRVPSVGEVDLPTAENDVSNS